MPKKTTVEDIPVDSEEEVPVKLTKKGQKPRQFTEEHLEKLKLAREKARETQQKNKEIRQMEKENKAEEERKRKEAIVAKNKEIKSSLKKVPNKPSNKVSALAKTEPQEEIPEDNVQETDVSEPEEEENIKIIKKEKPKKKTKKPIVIVEQSESSESEEEQQVVYVKKKSKNFYKKVQKPRDYQEPEPETHNYVPVRQPYRPNNPFHNLNYRNF